MFLKKWLILAVLALPLLHPAQARSGEWRVTPIQLEFGKDAKSGAVRVINEAADRLEVQLKAFEWTQDAEGRDRYAESGDVIFFPKLMIFDKAEERIVRVGIRTPAVAAEKTYRLFIEEIPTPGKGDGVNVAIAIRFGVPIFVMPVREEFLGELGKIEAENGRLAVRVKNAGNVHFVIRSVTWKGIDRGGKEIFTRDLAGWYLLPGASRLYSTELPPDVCPQAARVQVEVKTDKTTFAGESMHDKKMCAP